MCVRKSYKESASGREVLIQNINSAKDIPPPQLSIIRIPTHIFFLRNWINIFFFPPQFCQEQKHGVRTNSPLRFSTESTPQSKPTPAIILRGFIRKKGRKRKIWQHFSFYLFLYESPVSIINLFAIIFNVDSFLATRAPCAKDAFLAWPPKELE